jgi:hypothetical protein
MITGTPFLISLLVNQLELSSWSILKFGRVGFFRYGGSVSCDLDMKEVSNKIIRVKILIHIFCQRYL